MQLALQDGVCMEMSFNRTKLLRGHADVPYAREDLLKKAVALYGPVAIGKRLFFFSYFCLSG
jgi:hypothetical protein